MLMLVNDFEIISDIRSDLGMRYLEIIWFELEVRIAHVRVFHATFI